MFIKICGITNVDDALLATRLGASALGFVFAPSKRQITPENAANIIRQLPHHVEKVGVFVNEKRDKILQIAENTELLILITPHIIDINKEEDRQRLMNLRRGLEQNGTGFINGKEKQLTR